MDPSVEPAERERSLSVDELGDAWPVLSSEEKIEGFRLLPQPAAEEPGYDNPKSFPIAARTPVRSPAAGYNREISTIEAAEEEERAQAASVPAASPLASRDG